VGRDPRVSRDSDGYSRELRHRLDDCPAGIEGWRDFENVCLEILEWLFVPPLTRPFRQSKTYSGLDRRDAIFPNRVVDTSSTWGLLRHDLDARLVLVEFKNYLSEEIGKDETDQTRNYLKPTMGKLAIICSNKLPADSAHRRRNTIYSDEGKVILFLTTASLKEMLDMKDRGDDPSDFIIDSVEQFFIQHE